MASGCCRLSGGGRRRQQLPAASVDVMAKFQREAAADLDKGTLWRFKFFVLFPILLNLRHLDHYSRVVFPVAFGIFVLGQFSKVGFGTAHNDLLNTVQCYRDQL